MQKKKKSKFTILTQVFVWVMILVTLSSVVLMALSSIGVIGS